MHPLKTLLSALTLFAAATALRANDKIPPDQFDTFRNLIRPHDDESRWRQIDWLTSLGEARVKAAAEGKPILIWSGGGAPPVGGC